MAFKPINDNNQQSELVKLNDGDEFIGYFAGGPRQVQTKKGMATAYDFLDSDGGRHTIFANKSLRDELEGAVVGLSTLIRREATITTKSGNPFVVYRALQDAEDSIEVDASNELTSKSIGA